MVLHGTDTMAYTSSALSFLLPGFGKPVVVTGSQIPITRIRSDGRQNFIGALQVAAQSNVDEVTLLFGEVLLRGNRATKMDASASMRSTHHGFRHRGHRHRHRGAPWFRPGTRPESEHHRREPGHVAAVRLFPGFSASILGNLCRPPLQGLVIEAYGPGTDPPTTGTSSPRSRPPPARGSSWWS